MRSNMNTKFPKVIDQSKVGSYPTSVKSGGGYFYDEALEYRVWVHPTNGNVYLKSFPTYEDALSFSTTTEGAEDPLVLVYQEEYIDEPNTGELIHIKQPRITEWKVEWLKRNKGTKNNIPKFLNTSVLTYNILKEPKGTIYQKLIDHALHYCSYFTFTLRHSLQVYKSIEDLINELEPFLLSKKEQSEWPGTKLLSDTAIVYEYKLSQETVDILQKTTTSLFSWIQPELPEDLCLKRHDKTPWLVTITHEKDGYFLLSSEEKASLVKDIPDLVLK